jgi:ribosomal protein L37AE/L43A
MDWYKKATFKKAEPMPSMPSQCPKCAGSNIKKTTKPGWWTCVECGETIRSEYVKYPYGTD